MHDITRFETVEKFAASVVDAGEQPGSFFVTDLSAVMGQMAQWRAELPMVEPFYAVKCLPDPVVMKTLANLGCGFDVATMGEMQMVLHELGPYSFGPKGKAASTMIFAHPCKTRSHIEYAISNGVQMTTFDGEDELYKIADVEGCEKLRLLLRIVTDDASSVCKFSVKYGARMSEMPHLMRTAQALGLNVVGVSFHVGSGCGDAMAYSKAISDAGAVFEFAAELGMPAMSVIDMGGGFPGDRGGYGGPGMPSFQKLAAVIRPAVAQFQQKMGAQPVRFIAEPGRYFASGSTTIVSQVQSRKGGFGDSQSLYLDDGVYGSFNNVMYDHAEPVPVKLDTVKHAAASRAAARRGLPATEEVDGDGAPRLLPTAVYGPTCDGIDQMCKMDKTLLPRCDIGDWLGWANCGAYTHTASYIFNGFTHRPKRLYVKRGEVTCF